VLLNPGGPGASGFDFVAFGGNAIASEMTTDSLDLIGFDPRGVDRSGGIRCVTDEYQDKHLYVDDTPDTPQEQALYDESKKGFADACAKKYGDTLRFYSTANTARDMDAIRVALGDRQISYLGGSYGTYLGATYATMFPDRVRAMVLDSAEEPNGDTAEEQFKTQLVGFEGAFDNWSAWCEGEPTCQFTTTDVGARWDALKRQLDDTPIAGADGRLANNATVERATIAALYSEGDWPVLGKALAQAESGDPIGIFALADTYNGRNDDGTFDTLYQSLPVINCASGIGTVAPADTEALAATLRAAAPRFGKDITADDLKSPAEQCTTLVGHADPVALSYSGDAPIVVVGGANDPATPIRWAQKMTAELGPNTRMVTFTGEGHGQLLVSSCVTKIEMAVLADLELPDPDTVCDPDPVVPQPDWWNALPVPDGVSDVVALPAVTAAIGATPTQFFSELRTTSLSATDAIAAYTAAFSGDGLQKADAPAMLPINGVLQGAYSDGVGKVVVVEAFEPAAFDDKSLQSAKAEVPPNTTVVWLIALQV
jgi:pimeloyl-ACP methyl ester carboxylesterase